MHSPALLDEILELRLRATVCEPRQVAEIQAEMDTRKEQIRLLSKVSMARINAVIDRRYPEFVAAKVASGELVQKKPATLG